MNQNYFYQKADIFLGKLFQDFREQAIALEGNWDIDHICYRVDSEESYELHKEAFSQFSNLLIESHVNGRMIATYKLHKPIYFQDWRIDLVELPAPKKGKITPQGFEHIEIVADITFDELKEKFKHLTFDEKGLEKLYNKELEITLGHRNVKFHHSSLESVIALEKNDKAWRTIQSSRVLELFRDFSPLIAGAIPLAIDLENSDIELLLCAQNLKLIENLCLDYFKGTAKTLLVDGLETFVFNFVYEDVAFEVFAQHIPSVKQKAYKYFLIEEKLLKFRGADLREKICSLKKMGLKTAPAFAQALNLSGDPYVALLDLQLQKGTPGSF